MIQDQDTADQTYIQSNASQNSINQNLENFSIGGDSNKRPGPLNQIRRFSQVNDRQRNDYYQVAASQSYKSQSLISQGPSGSSKGFQSHSQDYGLLRLSQKYSFPNYFEARKQRIKVDEKEEEYGRVQILNLNPSKQINALSQSSQNLAKVSQQQSQEDNPERDRSEGGYITDQDIKEGDQMKGKKNDFSGGSSFSRAYLDLNNFEATGYVDPSSEAASKLLLNKTVPQKHKAEKKEYHQKLWHDQKIQTQMKYYLDSGFNILLYGVGSKLINGFHSGANIKSLTIPLSKFVEKFMFHKPLKACPVQDQLSHLKKLIEEIRPEEYDFQNVTIIIHSMDMGQSTELRNSKVRLICSVDNLGVSNIWTEQILDNFNFISMKVDTFEDFDVELEYQPPLFSYRNDNDYLGLQFVLKSMTVSQVKVLRLIAEQQLKNEMKGVCLRILLSLCVEEMLAFSTKEVKDLLGEAFDHKLVVYREDPKDNDRLLVAINYPQIIVEQLANEGSRL